MRWLTVFVFCLLSIYLYAQSSTGINSVNAAPDSLGRQQHISSPLNATTDSLHNTPDYSSAANNKKLNQFLQELTARENGYRQQLYLRWGLGIVFIAVLVLILVRKRK